MQADAGKLCGECGNHTMIRKDGCDFCTACGAVGTSRKQPTKVGCCYLRTEQTTPLTTDNTARI